MSRSFIEKSKYLILILAAVIIALSVCPMLGIANAGSLTDSDVPSEMKTERWYFDEQYFDIAFAKQYFADFKKLDKPVYIGVIDTGINYNHELFKKTLLWVEDNGTQKPVGYNVGNSATPALISDSASDYHGTHVAGIISSIILELGLEDSVKIIPVRATNSQNQFTSTAVAAAIRWLCGENGLEARLGHKLECSVINMSISILKSAITSSSSWSNLTKLQGAINDYVEKTVFVSAAGNNGKDTKNDISYPASITEIVSVMNYENGLDSARLNSTSNFGDYDLAASGTNVYSATSGTNSYGTKSGTSMAAPFVSMLAAMLKLRYPTVTASKLTQMLRGHESKITMRKGGYLIKGVDVKSVLETDFLASEDYKYITPTKIVSKLVSAQSTLKQNMRDRKDVKFFATISPADSHNPKYDKEIVWVVEKTNADGTTKISRIKNKGNKFVFDKSFGGSKNTVWAELAVGKETLVSEKTVIEIKYAPFDFSAIRITPVEWVTKDNANKKAPCYLGTPLALSFTDIQYCDASVEIKWFVDGELVQKQNGGTTFNYIPTTLGKHTIAAKIDGNKVAEFEVEVKLPLALGFTVFGVVLALAIGLTLVIALPLKATPFMVKSVKDRDEEPAENNADAKSEKLDSDDDGENVANDEECDEQSVEATADKDDFAESNEQIDND